MVGMLHTRKSQIKRLVFSKITSVFYFFSRFHLNLRENTSSKILISTLIDSEVVESASTKEFVAKRVYLTKLQNKLALLMSTTIG